MRSDICRSDIRNRRQGFQSPIQENGRCVGGGSAALGWLRFGRILRAIGLLMRIDAVLGFRNVTGTRAQEAVDERDHVVAPGPTLDSPGKRTATANASRRHA